MASTTEPTRTWELLPPSVSRVTSSWPGCPSVFSTTVFSRTAILG